MTNTPDADSRLAFTALQRDVVEAPPGRLVLLGAAGSGKTTLIRERASRLIARGANAATVLILAPSRRGAVALGRAVQDRLGAALSPISTSFHGLALTILRRHYRAMGYATVPVLLDTSRHFHALREMLRAENPASWPHLYGQLGGGTLNKLVYDVVMGSTENGLSPVEVQRRARLWGQADLEEVAAFLARYQARLKSAGVVDFGTLLAVVLDLLAANGEVAASYRRAYRHVLVDEFEQANFAQSEMLHHLVDEGTDLIVAGDPAQAINSHRSGSFSYLLTCAERTGARVVVSYENHRSGRQIAGFGRVLRPQDNGTDARDRQAAPCAVASMPEEGSVVLREFTYLSEESAWIGAEIQRLSHAGIPPAGIAVLVRSLATPLVKLLVDEFARRHIPHQLQNGRAALDDPLVHGAVALMRYLAHPAPSAVGTAGQLFQRILDSSLAGLPPFGLQELRRAVALAGRDLGQLEADGLAGLWLDRTLRRSVSGLLERLGALRKKRAAGASTLLWEIWRRFPAFRDDALSRGESSRALAALLNALARLEDGKGAVGLPDFLALVDDGYFEQLASAGQSARGVAITTVHQAKGQVWQAVFMPGLVEGSFPLRRSPLDVSTLLAREVEPPPGQDRDAAAAGLVALRQARHIVEEQRVFYAGISRPRSALYLSYSRRSADGTSGGLPSRFLDQGASWRSVETRPAQDALPLDVDGAVVHYRRLLRSGDPLTQAKGLYALSAMRERWPDAVRPEQWWGNVDETSGADSPFPDGKLHLSASRLGMYRDCPLAYQFSYHWRLGEPEGAALTIGSILHTVLEEYHRPGSPLARTREALEEELERHFDERAFRYRPIARQARKVLSKMLDLYYPRYGQSDSTIAVERPFTFAFGPHQINGCIDRIDRLPSGGLELIDYKTGQPVNKPEAENDLQLGLYDLAFCADETLAAFGRPTWATYIYVKHIGPRADGKRSYAPTEESRELLRARIAYYAAAILAERFPSHYEIAEAFPDLDPAELDRALHKQPCRFCDFA